MSTDYPTPHREMQPRFWNPSGAALSLTPEGFLWNPLDDFQQHINPDIVQLSEVRDHVCLVLLGEPGAGKSTELRREYEIARDSPDSGVVLFFNLAEYTSEDAIGRHIFGDPAWQSWREGTELTLFLDSYDECRLSLMNVANVLVRELRSLGSRDRLKLQHRKSIRSLAYFAATTFRGTLGKSSRSLRSSTTSLA